MSKVLFIYQDEKMPSSRIRIFNLLPEVQKEGIHSCAVCYPKTIFEKIRLLKKMKQFDIVYVQKKLLSLFDTALLRRFAKKLIFDFDDAIYYRQDTYEVLESKSRYLKFKYLVQNVDLIVAGNKTLSDYASQFNKNVVVIPSAVETADIPIKDYAAVDNNIIIGWVGGKGNLHHLKMLFPIFQRLSLDYRIQVNILCNASIEIPSVKIKCIPWKLETQAQEIALFDIGVMPLPNNKWTQGKCGYKALQYMAASVPPVVSDVGINRDIVEHSKEGLVVSSLNGFYDAIKALIDDKDKRKEMGLNARKKIEKFFSVHVVGKMLADVLKTGIF
jgi:glycosyltransferase involved in cell wall biosynthesis